MATRLPLFLSLLQRETYARIVYTLLHRGNQKLLFRNLIDLVSFEENAKNITFLYNFTGGQDILQPPPPMVVVETILHPLRHAYFIWALHRCDKGKQKSLTDRTQTKFQNDFSESFQCIVSNRCFISQKKPKFSVWAKIFLQSFLPFFLVPVKSSIHLNSSNGWEV